MHSECKHLAGTGILRFGLKGRLVISFSIMHLKSITYLRCGRRVESGTFQLCSILFQVARNTVTCPTRGNMEEMVSNGDLDSDVHLKLYMNTENEVEFV